LWYFWTLTFIAGGMWAARQWMPLPALKVYVMVFMYILVIFEERGCNSDNIDEFIRTLYNIFIESGLDVHRLV
jgi:hypothetical protein